MPLVSPERLHEVVNALRAGGVAAIPTDTVYGLAAFPAERAAIGRLAALRGRAAHQPIAVLFDTLDALAPHLADPRALERVLPFWPGALTAIVLAAASSELVAPVVTEARTIGVRQPDHGLAREVIHACGGILAVSSANRHGELPATTAGEVLRVFGEELVVLDGGETPGQVASTVVDLASEPPRILREGPVTAAQLGLEPASEQRG